MLVSIITPSYRNSSWLKLCIASVADQQVAIEHIIQDAASDDGTLDWLPQDRRVKVFVEQDQGMYDAINRGLRHATGDILGWLNCDEQYLPGALTAVERFFAQHPDVDVVFGDVVLVDPAGEYLCHRKVQAPLKYHTWTSHLSTLSCATFFRRKVVFDYGFFFDPRWRAAGDGEWMLRMLQRGVTMSAMKMFTSVFTRTGTNLGLGPDARRENQLLFETAPYWARKLKSFIVVHHRLRRLLHGSYSQKRFDYSLYTQQSPATRVSRHVEHPSFRC